MKYHFFESESKKEEDKNSKNILKEEKKDLSEKEISKIKIRYKVLINGKIYFRKFILMKN